MSGETAGQTAAGLRHDATGLRASGFGLRADLFHSGRQIAVAMATGAVVLIVLMQRHPGRRAKTARVHLDAPSPTGLPQNGAVQR